MTHRVDDGSKIAAGAIITNRNRIGPMDACLASLAAQETPPAWVVIADLGSDESSAAALRELADKYAVSYLRIEHHGPWNKCLAFNTGFRAALRRLFRPSHVIQLDADMVLHPQLLFTTVETLHRVAAMYCAPRKAPADVAPWWPADGIDGFRRMIEQCGPTVRLAS